MASILDSEVLVGTGHGRVRFFKQLKNQSFTELTGASNPLARVRTRFSVMPYAVDWDDDGDTDPWLSSGWLFRLDFWGFMWPLSYEHLSKLACRRVYKDGT